MGLKIRKVSLNLPFGLGGVDIEVSEVEVRAAWELYVEFATRVTSQTLSAGGGSVREALDSLYSLFGTTRQILRAAGPEVGDRYDALGPLAIRILNEGLRPFIVVWHTELRQLSVAEPDGELAHDRRAVFDRELEGLGEELHKYVVALGKIAGIEP